MEEKFLELKEVTVKIGGSTILEDISLAIHRGEQWVVTGPSGSGKTVLAHTLLGRHFHSGEIKYYCIEGNKKCRMGIVEQQHRFKNLANTNDLYYQQRFNSSDAEQTITVEEELNEYVLGKNNMETGWLDILHIRQLLSRPLIQLSNGENKRVQLAITLLSDPEFLVLDNPFTGLDSEGRKTLHEIIDHLSAKGMTILLITSPSEIPGSITHIACMEKGKITKSGRKENFQFSDTIYSHAQLDIDMLRDIKQNKTDKFTIAVKMVNVGIRYGDNTILKNINWEVRSGEKWNVSGPNGSGKSTLLSLITADNPQAYANEIYLFDRRRGSGESIWDIKKKIGFVSPELHLYFDLSATCFDVVASGLFDTVGLFRQLAPEQEVRVLLWMKLFKLEGSRIKRLAQLSGGEQRMILLARALIKNPPMLILDEPCQGLDDAQVFHFTNMINEVCEVFGITLIYVSHYATQLPACINNFLVLEKGMSISA